MELVVLLLGLIIKLVEVVVLLLDLEIQQVEKIVQHLEVNIKLLVKLLVLLVLERLLGIIQQTNLIMTI